MQGFIQAYINSIHAITGNIEWRGNAVQNISGLAFQQQTIGGFILNNNQGASIGDSILVKDYIQLKKGTLYTNEQLYLKRTAILHTLAQGTAIIGKVFSENIFKQKTPGIYIAGNPFANSINVNEWNHAS